MVNGLFIFIRNLIAVFFVYAYIYSPPLAVFPFGLIKLLLPFAYIELMISVKFRSYLKMFYAEFTLIAIILFYSLLIGLARLEWTISIFYQNLGLLFEALPLAIFIVYRWRKLDEHKINLMGVVYFAGVLATIISCFLLFNPEAQFFVNNHLLRSSSFLSEVDFRGFGFASSLLFAYGVTQGVYATMTLNFLFRESRIVLKILYLFLFVLFCVSALINARTGVLIPLGWLAYSFLSLKVSKFVFPAFFFGVLFSLINLEGLNEFVNEGVVDFVFEFFEESSSLGEKNTTYSILLDSVVYPLDITGWIFGHGVDLFYGIHERSDVGWLIQLYFGGLFYVVLIFCCVAFMAKKLNKQRNTRWFVPILLIAILVANTKGYFVSNNSGFRLLLLIYVLLISKFKINERSTGKIDVPVVRQR